MTNPTYAPGSPLADLKRVQEICKELEALLQREEKRHMMDSDPAFQSMLEEVIEAINEYVDYDPTPNEPGEPPMTAVEMHSGAWQQHQQFHS